ncbi:histidinol phosphate phosphatase domain-containing protein [Bacillus salipaludis]|uniref:Histidinol-phosphatase n=1 Tax=Bacillus salipaludis TaxID=2547811 RepID=A0AA90R8N8_9BACI|nr:histidinol phosphate phosphatase domain-containing protein [Bacillus salipaludis]MDQ6598578.1 histidinol phosphate phosphatase domain-containing protein [Bacillus salipaludis]
MKVDYHLHLEEGPYSLRWLERTKRAMDHFSPINEKAHTIEWMYQSMTRLIERVQKGAYDSSWIDLYLKEAKRKGLREVGIVDHLYRFKETRAYFEKYLDLRETDLGKMQRKWLDQVMTVSMGDFVRVIAEAKQRWEAEGITLRLGIEADYFPGERNGWQELLGSYEWDYVIGSVHYLYGWGFDNPETQQRFSEFQLEALYEDFFNVVEKAIRSKLFSFVAHLDNLKVFNYRPEESLLLAHYEKIAKALVETDTATEINAGLYYRYPVKEMCPSRTFLDVLIQKGVRFTTSSDSHFPDDIGAYIDLNTKTLLEKGIKEIATFEKGKRIMKPLG